MKALLLIFSISLPAFAEEKLEQADFSAYSHSNAPQATGYFGHPIGDHFEWTTYQRDYSRVNYGHRFEWSRTGLSKVSECIEVDSETGGEHYRELVDDAYCPKGETEFRWYIPYDGETSRCVELDKLTEGKRYSRLVDDHQCAKPTTTFVWSKKYEGAQPDCQEVDADTEGRKYRRPARDYFCEKTLNVQVAYGRKEPYIPARSPASVAKPAVHAAEFDKRFWEAPEDLEDQFRR